MTLIFEDSLLTGITDIDIQHEFLFDAINSLEDFICNKNGNDLWFTLCNLEEYASKHFQTEEEYMLKYNYPEMDEHVEQHREFSKNYTLIKKDFNENSIDENYIISLKAFLENWIVQHYTELDVKMARFIKNSIQK